MGLTVNNVPPLAIPKRIDWWVLVDELFDMSNPLYFLVSASLSSIIAIAISTDPPHAIVVDSNFSSRDRKELWYWF